MVWIFSFKMKLLNCDVLRSERAHSRGEKLGDEGGTLMRFGAEYKREILFVAHAFHSLEPFD
jgi:hypothetical protein